MLKEAADVGSNADLSQAQTRTVSETSLRRLLTTLL